MNKDKFVEKILIFVDRNGKVLDKHSTPLSASLVMRYDVEKLKINMHVYRHAMGNGSCVVEVRYKDKCVLKAGGLYVNTCRDVKFERYRSGKWEKLIKGG